MSYLTIKKMKAMKKMKVISTLSILMVLIIFQLNGSCAFGDKKTDKEVQKAYELRMKGEVDQAKALLETTLAKDSTNAMANFEMARLQVYMLTGGGDSKMEDIIVFANKASDYAPDNVIYSYYTAISSFLNAYMAMQMQQDDVKNYVADACEQFEKVLTIKPDYYEAMLYLVEIYGLLPPDMGGDSLKAVRYAEKLATMDTYFGAKAKAALAPEDTDFVKLWEDQLVSDQNNPQILMEVGRAYLYKNDPVNAGKYFDQAMESDPSKNTLILDLARFHMYKVMRDRELASTELPIAITFIQKYMESTPEPVVPLQAYSIGMLSLCERFMDNQEESEKLAEKAKSIDPYFSRASAVPSPLLFSPPDKICHQYNSFFSPF